jgi:hypothetical protein
MSSLCRSLFWTTSWWGDAAHEQTGDRRVSAFRSPKLWVSALLGLSFHHSVLKKSLEEGKEAGGSNCQVRACLQSCCGLA